MNTMPQLLLVELAKALKKRAPKTLRSAEGTPEGAADRKRAAVLVPLKRSSRSGSLEILFTRRTDSVEHHKGQISFPGGLCEEADRDSTETALRETKEELGLSPRKVRILGLLDDVLTAQSNFVVTPVVGVLPSPLRLRPKREEVAEIIRVPLNALQDPACQRTELWNVEGRRFPVYFYRHQEHIIWGATARILRNLLALM